MRCSQRPWYLYQTTDAFNEHVVYAVVVQWGWLWTTVQLMMRSSEVRPEANHTDVEVTAFAGEFQQRGVLLGTIDMEPVGHAHSKRPDDDAIVVGPRATFATREAKILRAIHSDLRSNFQQRDLALINELPNLWLVAPQQSRDILSRTIADANPNDFRRRALQYAQAVKSSSFVTRTQSRSGDLPDAR